MFKIGDIVEAWGCQGKVIKMDWAGVQVEFDNCLEKVFTEDGRYMDWHKEPSLKFVERPRAKVKKTMYQAIYRKVNTDYRGPYIMTTDLFTDEIIAKHMIESRWHTDDSNDVEYVGLGPAIEIEVDSE